MDQPKPFWERPESRRLEFKESLPKGDQLAKTVIAFANGGGGKIAFVKKNIALGARIGEVYREERWEYPLEAIREAISNAVIHRDYSILGSDIKLAIFDDMLEITSPGPLPDTLVPEELGTGRSEIRNRVLAPIFKNLKLIEAWGTGIQRMRNEIAAYPEIELVFQEVGHTFQVQFRKRGTIEQKKISDTSAATIDQKAGAAQVTAQVTAEVTAQVVGFCRVPRKASEIMEMLELKHWKTFQTNYLNPLLEAGIIERTIPDKPRSSKQQYRLGKNGIAFLKKMG